MRSPKSRLFCIRPRLLLLPALVVGAAAFLLPQLASASLDKGRKASYQWSLISPPSLTWPSSASPRVGALPSLHKTPKPSIHPNWSTPKASPEITLAAEEKSKEKKEGGRSGEIIGTLHQIFGLASLAFLTATLVLGQINAIDFLQGRLSSQTMLWAHRILAISTAVTYGGARVLAWIFPGQKEEESDGGFDSSKWHRYLGWVHGIGMIALIVGGIVNARLVPSSTDLKTAMTVSHLAAGYVTWASLTGAAVLITFF